MPYITQEQRAKWDQFLAPIIAHMREQEFNEQHFPSVGELNYLMTRLAIEYTNVVGSSYTTFNSVIGAFECAKQEYYRRSVAPYEDQKIKQNGDVYLKRKNT